MIMELGIECVAEGAENEEQVRLLQQFGCNIIQAISIQSRLHLMFSRVSSWKKQGINVIHNFIYNQLLTGACSRKADNSCKKIKGKEEKC